MTVVSKIEINDGDIFVISGVSGERLRHFTEFAHQRGIRGIKVLLLPPGATLEGMTTPDALNKINYWHESQIKEMRAQAVADSTVGADKPQAQDEHKDYRDMTAPELVSYLEARSLAVPDGDRRTATWKQAAIALLEEYHKSLTKN